MAEEFQVQAPPQPVAAPSVAEVEAAKTPDPPGTVKVTTEVNAAEAPEQPAEVNVEDATVIFVPFEDFEGRINQTEFQFRQDIPTKVSKADANVWLEAKKGYIK